MRKPLITSKMIYRIFQSKYRFGDLALFESIALASTQAEEIRLALSTAIASPPGEAKTRILSDVLSMFPENDYVLVDGAITEYHIAKEEKYQDLSHKLFCINDIEDIIRTYPKRRVAAILSFLKNLIDGHAQILTKNDMIDRKAENFGVLINVPEYLLIDASGKLRSQFLGTFFDRIIPFRFRTDWEKWKPYWDGDRLKESSLPTIELERGPVKWDFGTFRRRISGEATKLATLKFSSLPRNIDLVTAFLCGSALLNGRARICNQDFAALQQLRHYFGWSR
jgi:hypothetical protein